MRAPVYASSTQPAGTVSLPVCADLQAILESARVSFNYPDAATLLSALFNIVPGEALHIFSQAKPLAGARTCATIATISVSLSGDVETQAETFRLNTISPTPIATAGGILYPLLFATKEDMIAAALLSDTGPLAGYVLRFPPTALASVIAANKPGSAPVVMAVRVILGR
jgi:hypothetical protein